MTCQKHTSMESVPTMRLIQLGLYGVPDAGCNWNHAFMDVYQQCMKEPCLFVKGTYPQVVMFTIWVDDCFTTGSNLEELEHMYQVIQYLQKRNRQCPTYCIGVPLGPSYTWPLGPGQMFATPCVLWIITLTIQAVLTGQVSNQTSNTCSPPDIMVYFIRVMMSSMNRLNSLHQVSWTHLLMIQMAENPPLLTHCSVATTSSPGRPSCLLWSSIHFQG